MKLPPLEKLIKVSDLKKAIEYLERNGIRGVYVTTYGYDDNALYLYSDASQDGVHRMGGQVKISPKEGVSVEWTSIAEMKL